MKRTTARLITIFSIFGTSALFAMEDWSSDKVYSNAGNQVEHNGTVYENKWWTQGEEPGTTGDWGVWKIVNNADATDDDTAQTTTDEVTDTNNTWDSTSVYTGGDQVTYDGKVYEAQWWTQGEEPGTTGDWGVWRIVNNADVTDDDTSQTTTDEVTDDTQGTETGSVEGTTEEEQTSGEEQIDDQTSESDTVTPDTVETPVNTDKKVAGYFAEWGIYGRNYQVTDIPVEDITHINYAFLNIKDNKPVIGDSYAAIEKRFPAVTTAYGTYEAGDWNGEKEYYGNFERLNQLHDLVLNYYGKDIKLLFSVGGWTWSENFPEVISTDENRETFVNELCNLLEKYKFEGVSYDFEYPVLGPQFSYDYPHIEESAQFVALVKLTREKFNELKQTTGIDYQIAIAMNAAPKNLEYLDVASLSEYADHLDMMTYDYAAVAWGDGAQHQSAIYFDSANNSNDGFKTFNVNSIITYMVGKGVERGKLLVGIPFYGRSGNGITALYQSGGTIGTGTWENGVYDYDSVVGLSSKINVDTNPDYYKWDDTAKASYYLNSDKEEFISYDSKQAVQEKCYYVRDYDLGGVLFWEFSGNRNGELLDTVSDTFEQAL